MTQDEIIEMAQECGLVGMRPHLDGIYIESLLAFAKLVADKALAEHAMSETQRLGQEIEQEPLEYWNAVEGWVKIDEVRKHFDSVGCGTIYKSAGEGRVPLCLAQSEQEPVAKVIDWGIEGPRLQGLTEDWPEVGTLLYTSPPQRTWVGLTEKEHTEIAIECGCMSADWVFYGAAVERKLKERNT